MTGRYSAYLHLGIARLRDSWMQVIGHLMTVYAASVKMSLNPGQYFRVSKQLSTCSYWIYVQYPNPQNIPHLDLANYIEFRQLNSGRGKMELSSASCPIESTESPLSNPHINCVQVD